MTYLFPQIKPKEADITREIRRYLDFMGIFHWKNYGGGPIGEKGIADILGCWKGRLLAIEVKREKGKTSDKQEQFLRRVNAAGGLAFVARSVDDVMRELK